VTAVGTASQLEIIASYEIFTYRPKQLNALRVCAKRYRCLSLRLCRHSATEVPQTAVPDYIRPFLEFDDAERMRQSSYYKRVVDVMEELVKFTLQTRELARYLSDRCRSRGRLLRFVTALVWIASFISNVFQYA